MVDCEALKQAMGDLDEETVFTLLNEVMEGGGAQVNEAMKACQEGMNIVGDRFDSGEYFVSDLVFAGDLMTGAMDILRPAFAGKSEGPGAGRIIFCTVEGDLHDIGKNIVKAILEAGGIEVIDLGIDVPASVIVETAKKENIRVIALSGVLTLAIESMKATIQALEEAGIRDNVKVIIGGAPVTEAYCNFVGADAWSQNATLTLDIVRKWLAS